METEKVKGVKALEDESCQHTILMYYGRNVGAYCVACRVKWVREKIAYRGTTTTRSVLERRGMMK